MVGKKISGSKSPGKKVYFLKISTNKYKTVILKENLIIS